MLLVFVNLVFDEFMKGNANDVSAMMMIMEMIVMIEMVWTTADDNND